MVEATEMQLKQMKECELELFRAFIKICEKLSLRYYLLGGTLLGAVRHKGFIPWDDDIDVGMPRKDYEIFLKEAQKLLPDHYFVQSIETDPAFRLNYAKIRNSNTTFIEQNSRKFPINHGIFIDIFPLDVYPERGLREFIIKIKKNIFYYRIGLEFDTPDGHKRNFSKTFILKLVFLSTKLLYPDSKKALIKQKKLFMSAKNGNRWANHCGAWKEKEIVPAEWYGEGTILTFEGIQVVAPKEYDQWLTRVYGDYMQLPPVEKRVTRHYAEQIDPNTPYTAYINN